MAFDQALADRVRTLLASHRGLTEKRMFGGVGFLLHGNMCVGVWKEFLIVRLGADAHDDALAEPHVREFDITGKVMRGWAMIAADGVESHASLSAWVDRAVQFVATLPPK